MNLYADFCQVCQDNLTEGEGANIKNSILEDNRKSYQNSFLCLMFYEKINMKEQMLIDQVDRKEQNLNDHHEGLVLSSMSYCQINRECGLTLPKILFERQLLLELQKTTVLLVTKKQYELLYLFWVNVTTDPMKTGHVLVLY